MVTLDQLIERANEWLENRNVGSLNSNEIVYLTTKVVNILDLKKYCTILDLERSMVLHFAVGLCKIRGYKYPVVFDS